MTTDTVPYTTTIKILCDGMDTYEESNLEMKGCLKNETCCDRSGDGTVTWSE